MGERDVGSIARRLARTLAYLRADWGLEYLPLVNKSSRTREPVDGHERTARSASVHQSRSPGASAPDSRPSEPSVDRKHALRVQAEQWSAATKLEYMRRHNLGDCQRCPLARTRTNIVFGVGNPEADLMFVGEAPGADEDRKGEPFVGRAGQRLDQWIVALGLQRDQVYISNVLKCRPPGNRDPRPAEVDKCSPFLGAQIRAIRPKVIVALGRHAGMLLSKREDLSLRAMRSARLVYEASDPKLPQPWTVPLVVTYHPAYVLRQEGAGESDSANELVLQDLRRALEIVRQS
jgi:DNA polymerase